MSKLESIIDRCSEVARKKSERYIRPTTAYYGVMVDELEKYRHVPGVDKVIQDYRDDHREHTLSDVGCTGT